MDDFDFNKIYVSQNEELALVVVGIDWVQHYDFTKQWSQKNFMPSTKGQGWNTVQLSCDDKFAFTTNHSPSSENQVFFIDLKAKRVCHKIQFLQGSFVSDMMTNFASTRLFVAYSNHIHVYSLEGKFPLVNLVYTQEDNRIHKV